MFLINQQQINICGNGKSHQFSFVKNQLYYEKESTAHTYASGKCYKIIKEIMD